MKTRSHGMWDEVTICAEEKYEDSVIYQFTMVFLKHFKSYFEAAALYLSYSPYFTLSHVKFPAMES